MTPAIEMSGGLPNKVPLAHLPLPYPNVNAASLRCCCVLGNSRVGYCRAGASGPQPGKEPFVQRSPHCSVRRAVAQVVEFVGVSVEIKELGAKVLVVDVFPIRRPHHEGPRLVRGQPEGRVLGLPPKLLF